MDAGATRISCGAPVSCDVCLQYGIRSGRKPAPGTLSFSRASEISHALYLHKISRVLGERFEEDDMARVRLGDGWEWKQIVVNLMSWRCRSIAGRFQTLSETWKDFELCSYRMGHSR